MGCASRSWGQDLGQVEASTGSSKSQENLNEGFDCVYVVRCSILLAASGQQCHARSGAKSMESMYSSGAYGKVCHKSLPLPWSIPIKHLHFMQPPSTTLTFCHLVALGTQLAENLRQWWQTHLFPTAWTVAGGTKSFRMCGRFENKGIIDHTKSVWDNPTGYDRYDLGWDGTWNLRTINSDNVIDSLWIVDACLLRT